MDFQSLAAAVKEKREKTMDSTKELVQYEQDQKEHIQIASHAYGLSKAIKDEISFGMAVAFLADIKNRRKRWAEIIDPAVRDAHKAHVKIKAVKNEIDGPLERAELEILKPAIAKYEQVQEQERLIKQAELERESRKRQEEEKLKIAVEYEKKGEPKIAEQVLDAPTIPIAIELPKQAQAKGISYQWRYSARVVDRLVLLKAIMDLKCNAACVTPNMVYLNQRARSDKDSFNIPGVELVKERSVSASTVGR